MRNRPNGPVFLIINTKYTFAAMVLQKSKTRGGDFPNILYSFLFRREVKAAWGETIMIINLIS